MQQLPPALAALGEYKQFVPYFLTPSKKKPGKMDKIPLGSSTDPDTWMTFEQARDDPRRHDCEGFVVSATDDFFFFDLDGCLVDGQWTPLATQMCQAFKGCAIEVSQSGSGLHIIGTGKLKPHGTQNKKHGIELYDDKRFIALTGTHAEGDVRFRPHQPLLDWLVDNFFSEVTESGELDELTDEPDPRWNGPTSDEELIRRAMNSKKSAAGAFGGKATFADLWEADPNILAQFYPSDTGDVYGRSEADAALVQHLCFWTGNHGKRIERLMWLSGLVREKWTDRDGYYFPVTIGRAIKRQKEFLHDKPLEIAAPVQTTGHTGEIKMVEGSTFVSADKQPEFFKGCTYVISAHRILTPDGAMLRPDQFKAKYGGFTFPMDNANEKMTRNAWECFTESQVFRAPKVDSTMFRPDLEPGYILNEGGYSRVNSYVPVTVARQAGDASPFLNHLAKLMPDERDRRIFLSYLAAVVQYKGVKFKWAPVLQGTPGNGKTFFTYCLMHAIGERYCHLPSVETLTEKFNSWIFDRILIGVEDVYNPERTKDVMEDILKPMITGDFLSKRAMQTDATMQNCVANFIFNSNHKDAMRKDENDRRLAVFYTRQQSKADNLRDGITSQYVVNLYAWLKSGGYAIVTDFLYSYEIPDEFNPATHCPNAPDTSSTREAIQVSLGGVEQEIQESIIQGKLGFCGGFISSVWLARLLDEINASRRINHNKRAPLLATLGYVLHPALHDGRTHRFVLPDGTKSRLFVSKDSEWLTLTDPEEVCRKYEEFNYASPK